MKIDGKMKFYITISLIAIFLLSISLIKTESGQSLLSETAQYIKGGKKVILPVEIGEYALIGAGSVVTNNIPPRKVAYGNPAKVVGNVKE